MRYAKWTALVAVLALVLLALGGTSATGGSKGKLIKRAALGQIKAASIPVKVKQHGRVMRVKRRLPFISPGTIDAARAALGKSGYVSRRKASARSGRIQPFFVTPSDEPVDRGEGADEAGGSGHSAGGPENRSALGFRLATWGCSGRDGNTSGGDDHGDRGKNVRANQDCTFRRQAEEDIAFNPADPDNLLGGQNDSRVGFNQCGIDWSLDNGRHWGDLLPPFRQKLNFPAAQEPTAGDPNRHTILGGPGTLHTYDAGSDPTMAFDSRGRGFFSCVTFDVASNASMLYVTQSPVGAKGSFFFNLAQGTSSADPGTKRFIVAEDNSSLVFHDKNFITADTNPGSPNRDNVYVTWTVFKFDVRCGPQPNPNLEERYCESPVFGSMSSDHGVHWSAPEQISGVSDTLCFFGNFLDPTANPHSCNFDQGSDPAALPNGDLEVIFNNGNTAAGNPNAQQLGVHCHPTGDSRLGTAHLNCVSPSLVGSDIITGEPQCDFGRGPEECIPGAYIRTNDFPRISGNPTSNTLFATWQDYQRRDNGTKEFSIQLSRSTDGGLTWEPVRTINLDTGLDHYFPAVDSCKGRGGDDDDRSLRSFHHSGGDSSCTDTRVGVSYYRTDRVPNEDTTPPGGFAPGVNPGVQAEDSDYVLSGGTWPSTPFDFFVLSPTFAPPDGVQAGFNGDYSGLLIKGKSEAHPIWSDTRNMDPYSSPSKTAESGGVNNGVVHDEDIFTDNVKLPKGRCGVHTGRIGRSRC